MFGFHNLIAWIDLTERTVSYRPIDERDIDAYCGGAVLGAAILARLIRPGLDPLDPDNPLIFMTGAFTGSRIPAGSRHELVSLSPLTGIYGESNCGGAFGAALKHGGLDGLVITGRADAPLSLVVGGGRVSFREAADLWGLDVFLADDKIKEQMGKEVVTAIIGPAGENLVRIASVSHNGRLTRSAGRCGLGAVMGSKKLKAVIATGQGSGPAPLADPDGLKESVSRALPIIRERLDMFGKIGTPGGVFNYEKLGNLPINNWRDARAPELAAKTTGTLMAETIQKTRSGCKNCPIQCSRLVEVKDGPFASDGLVKGPEYETLAVFGALQLNDRLDAIVKANELCNRLGLDTISAGAAIAFANECLEKGILKDGDGLDLGFGKPAAHIELLKRIAHGQGWLAQALGQGVRRAARIFGHNAEEYAVEVKGLEFPMHDPRFSWGHAISYPTGPRGACHLSSLSHPFEISVALPELGYQGPYPGRETAGKAQWTLHLQDVMSLTDSLIQCKFAMLNNALTLSHFREWYKLTSGRDLDQPSFLELGARAFALKRMINVSRGVSRKDDDLPPRMRTLRKRGEGVDFDVPPFYPMLAEYYQLRGWTEEGWVSDEVVARLGLTEFAHLQR